MSTNAECDAHDFHKCRTLWSSKEWAYNSIEFFIDVWQNRNCLNKLISEVYWALLLKLNLLW